ncbi:MAG: hypothetical protein JST87_07310 [Bacteroidetes bacterium]|nr:hypothetical protein [Bacteroidota bacterium]MBS1935465.1 hypothetical protein [Bacteroidota bacterium]
MRSFIKIFYCTILLLVASRNSAKAQPYIDVINTRYTSSPDAGIFNHNKKNIVLNYFNASTTLPVLFKNKKDFVILSPFYEEWSSTINGIDSFQKHHRSLALPVSLLKSIGKKWNILITPIVRINDTVICAKSKWQFGGALLASHKSDDGKFTWKFGVYINGDLFGVFVMPLVGIDWQVSPKTNLFGVLPGNLTLEHKVSNHFYYGATFRAITNSYTDRNNKYWRVDENQSGLFADYYFSKNIVLNIEAGHSLFRKIRTGNKNEAGTDWMANDNVYLKLSLAYRIRFR